VRQQDAAGDIAMRATPDAVGHAAESGPLLEGTWLQQSSLRAWPRPACEA
jgi:hypothetical protein